MSNNLAKAINAVRATVRLQILTNRLREVDPEIPLLHDDKSNTISPDVSARIALAKASLRDSEVARSPRVKRRKLQKDFAALYSMLTASWINLLLLVVPLGIASGVLDWGPVPIFTLNFICLIPLALFLGDITEDLALRFGDIIGGLLNATFGNIVELIISIAALEKGLYTVVATSLVGSILSNLLLVLGCCFLFGGFYFKTQTFNATNLRACSSLLLLSCIGIAMPTCAAHLIKSPDGTDDWILSVSRWTAVIMLLTYICYLVFQLHSHADYFTEEDEDEEDGPRTPGGSRLQMDEPLLSTPTAIMVLCLISVTVAAHSEFLTGSIEAVSEQTGLGQAFLGMIVLPIAGNACEHVTAIIVAMKDKMDLSLGIAVGSSLQIALFALPFTVIVGWATGHPMSLNLDLFGVVALVLSVVHANVVMTDAQSHWLMGVSLLVVYILIAIIYAFRQD
mmetsp:Transcript_26232/g.57287  ORF Transcript_26232/g.57287 Transcript_26232/m.57287 type:complete len:452 (-) Transcript_26232:128-1483(-)